MFALARLTRLSLLLAVSSTVALTQGCAADEVEDADSESGAVSTSRADDRIVDVPFYFSVPKAAISTTLNRQGYSYPTVWNPSTEVADAGLRMIVIKQGGQEVAQKKAARIDMAKQLARAGVLQDGDIALSFRPELAGTMAYPHIQMGTTHASLVYTQNGEAFNIDSPLDGEYVGQFSTLHFTGGINSAGKRDYGTDALQIIRPRAMNEARKANLQQWIGTLKRNLGGINGARQQVKFQKDYLTPIFASTRMTTKQTVTKLGQIILEQDKTTKLPMYCSEFAWHMLALSNCTAEEIRSAGPEGAECVAPIFNPLPLVSTDDDGTGLAEGPLQNVLLAPPAQRIGLIEQIFATGNAGGLSSGHRAVASEVAPLMDGDVNGDGEIKDKDNNRNGVIDENEKERPALKQYYQMKAQQAPREMTGALAAGLNAGVGNVGNYSPTAFISNAMLPEGVRAMDYVATVVFVDSSADYEKAKGLARNPIP